MGSKVEDLEGRVGVEGRFRGEMKVGTRPSRVKGRNLGGGVGIGVGERFRVMKKARGGVVCTSKWLRRVPSSFSENTAGELDRDGCSRGGQQ